MNIQGALQIYCGPNLCSYKVDGTYESLVWHKGNPLPKPTEKELEDAAKAWDQYRLPNDKIDQQLAVIDAKKVRAITDLLLTGDNSRLAALEQHASILRQQRRQDPEG